MTDARQLGRLITHYRALGLDDDDKIAEAIVRRMAVDLDALAQAFADNPAGTDVTEAA